MRLWSVHPKYLDAKGLVACWRESLLAQDVLLNKTKGYKHHPQLNRFKACNDPVYAIGKYLYHLYYEANRRGYKFNKSKIVKYKGPAIYIPVHKGQVQYEFNHLLNKLKTREPGRYIHQKATVHIIHTHPLFRVLNIEEIEIWEKVSRKI